MQNFRRLFVWRRAHALAINVERASRAPEFRGRSIRSQMVRAAESISANVVEGCGASTQREFARYLDIAIKSSCELENHLLLARDYGALPRADCRHLSSETNQIRRMLTVLRRRVLERALSESSSG